MRLRDLGVGARLGAGFAVLLLLLAGVTVVGIGEVNSIGADLSTINDVNSVKQRYAINFRGSVHDRAIALRDVVLVSSDEELEPVLDEIDRLSADYAESAVALGEMLDARDDILPREREINAGIEEIEAHTLPLIDRVIELEAQGDVTEATRVLMEEARPAFVEWLARINQFIDLQEAMNQEIGAGAQDAAHGFQTLMLVVATVAVAIGALIAGLATRSIVRPLSTVSAAANEIAEQDLSDLTVAAEAAAQGDLTVRFRPVDRQFDTGRGDELGEVLRSFSSINTALASFGNAFNATLADLAETVGGATEVANAVRTNSDTVATTSSETARGAQEVAASISGVADATVDQAARTEEMIEAIGDIESSLRLTIEALAGAAIASEEARRLSDDGRATLGETSAAMERITGSIDVAARHVTAMGDSSRQVEEIVDLIRAIAEQTNLLALNAAIEAARAGEAGRGFAVVAAEVKALAEESSSSTDKVAEVVSQMRGSVEQAIGSMDQGRQDVEAGTSSVGAVESAFSAIDGSVHAIGARVDEVGRFGDDIAAAAARIRERADQLVVLADGNSAASQQVAATSEESAAVSEELGAASQELSSSASELSRLMARFKTG